MNGIVSLQEAWHESHGVIFCMQIAHNDWVNLVNKCEVFKSQVPLPACSDSAGEAAEGVPSCTAAETTASIQVRGLANLSLQPIVYSQETHYCGRNALYIMYLRTTREYEQARGTSSRI